MQATSLLQENENSSKSIAAKPSLVGNAKQGASGAPASRRFGTAISVNTNVPVPSTAAGKALPTAMPAAKTAATSSFATSAPADNVTAADIAGAMDIDIADRYNAMRRCMR